MRHFAVYAVLIAALFISACGGGDYSGSEGSGTFDWNLRGTWVSNDPGVYSGTLTINSNAIIISGYSESQTPPPTLWVPGGDDNQRPFKIILLKDTPLKGYAATSEDSIKKFYIQDIDGWKEIPYTYYEVSGSYPRDEFLMFTFGDRPEILKKQKEEW